MTLRTRVRSLEQHDVVTRESLRIAKGKFTLSQLQAEYAEQEVRELREFWVTNRFEMDELQSRAQDIEASFWDLGRHLRKAMLEIYHCVTSTSFTTPDRVWQNAAIASGLVIKLEIVGPQTLQEWLSRKEEPKAREQAMERKILWISSVMANNVNV
ncbi:hypothetical protein Tco_1063111 [Tanacetum coccineum]